MAMRVLRCLFPSVRLLVTTSARSAASLDIPYRRREGHLTIISLRLQQKHRQDKYKLKKIDTLIFYDVSDLAHRLLSGSGAGPWPHAVRDVNWS